MLSTAPLLETSLDGLTLHRRGKVRDVYDVTLPSGEPALLIVATDRISAFDYVLGSGIPDKGKVLTQLSGFWFERMGDLVPHHVVETDVAKYPAALQPYAAARARIFLVESLLDGDAPEVKSGARAAEQWLDTHYQLVDDIAVPASLGAVRVRLYLRP